VLFFRDRIIGDAVVGVDRGVEGGAYGIENERLIAISAQNVSRSEDMNSLPLSQCHPVNPTIASNDLWSDTNCLSAASTAPASFVFRK
jgi:hypothetical protein